MRRERKREFEIAAKRVNRVVRAGDAKKRRRRRRTEKGETSRKERKERRRTEERGIVARRKEGKKTGGGRKRYEGGIGGWEGMKEGRQTKRLDRQKETSLVTRDGERTEGKARR